MRNLKDILNDKKQNRIKMIIAAELIALVACSAWLFDYAGNKLQQMRGASIAEISANCMDMLVPDEAAVRKAALVGHVISHRGYPAKTEEHTFESYDLAIKAGSRFIEQDLVISADGTLYVSHDDTAARMTGNPGSFRSMSDKEIDALKTHGGSKILKLTDVFDKYGKTVCYVIEVRGYDDATIKAVTDAIGEYGMENNVILQSFDMEALELLEKPYPDIPKMFLCNTQSELNSALGSDIVDYISINSDGMNEGNVKTVHEFGKKFSAWTLNSEDEIQRAIELGVDMYFTNDTGLAIKLENKYRK